MITHVLLWNLTLKLCLNGAMMFGMHSFQIGAASKAATMGYLGLPIQRVSFIHSGGNDLSLVKGKALALSAEALKSLSEASSLKP